MSPGCGKRRGKSSPFSRGRRLSDTPNPVQLRGDFAYTDFRET